MSTRDRIPKTELDPTVAETSAPTAVDPSRSRGAPPPDPLTDPSPTTDASVGATPVSPGSDGRITLVSPPPRASSGAPCAPPCPEDIVDGLRFLHLVTAQSQARIADLSASLYALVETLIAGGQLPIASYEQRRQKTVARENEQSAREASVQISAVADKYALDDLPEIDCAALLPICRARCCRLCFPLSVQDLDERIVRWTYGRPYLIAQRPDGTCVHCAEDRCSIYTYRPAACRQFDCRSDPRIWADFERRIPADAPDA